MSNDCFKCGAHLWADETCYKCYPEDAIREEKDAEIAALKAELAEEKANRERDRHHWLKCMAENERLREALEKIRDTDYRGNRSQESIIAFKALAGDSGGEG
jgi:hypothetical protein